MIEQGVSVEGSLSDSEIHFRASLLVAEKHRVSHRDESKGHWEPASRPSSTCAHTQALWITRPLTAWPLGWPRELPFLFRLRFGRQCVSLECGRVLESFKFCLMLGSLEGELETGIL